MQQWLELGGNVKKAPLGHEYVVRKINRTPPNMLAQRPVFTRQQDIPANDQAKSEHDDQCRKNSLDTPTVKLEQTKSVSALRSENDAGDQVAGNDEKNINADKSARQPTRECVKDYDRNNRQRAQPVNIAAIRQMRIVNNA